MHSTARSAFNSNKLLPTAGSGRPGANSMAAIASGELDEPVPEICPIGDMVSVCPEPSLRAGATRREGHPEPKCPDRGAAKLINSSQIR